MKKIELNNGMYAIVYDKDYDKVKNYKWIAVKKNLTYYAQASINRKTISMHKLLMPPPEGMQIDHKNHNGLDNRRKNLRICTCKQNQYNRRKYDTSLYKGVVRRKQKRRIAFMGVIKKDQKRHYLGTFSNPKEAALAYDKKAVELFGEFAWLNFPKLTSFSLCRPDVEQKRH